jgi:Alpha/beta hydrolase family
MIATIHADGTTMTTSMNRYHRRQHQQQQQHRHLRSSNNTNIHSSMVVLSETLTTTKNESRVKNYHASNPHRILQLPMINYTSPPLDDALHVTPLEYRDDTVIAMYRRLATTVDGCFTNTSLLCHIPFIPDATLFHPFASLTSSTTDDPHTLLTPIGIILYGGAFVDPRSYAVLAHRTMLRYGIPVVIPIFANDIALTPSCYSRRLELAKKQFPYVTKWILIGHSLGGSAAVSDLWYISRNDTYVNDLGGLVLLASSVQPAACGIAIDLSDMQNIPTAIITASNDLILNKTRFELNKVYAPGNGTTWFVTIPGGNHAGFGNYNDTLRSTMVPFGNQIDGPMELIAEAQWDITVSVIYQVVSRVASQHNISLPQAIMTTSTYCAARCRRKYVYAFTCPRGYTKARRKWNTYYIGPKGPFGYKISGGKKMYYKKDQCYTGCCTSSKTGSGCCVKK